MEVIFYFALNALFAAFSLIDLCCNKRRISIYLFGISLLILFIFAFIRWKTGTDWDAYYDMYTWIYHPWESFSNGMEHGFVFINHLGKALFDNYTGVLFLFSLIIYSATCFSYPKLCNHPMVAIWVSFCISFAGMLFVRQNVAASVLLVSMIFAYRQKLAPFFIFVFLASLFHRTAWIFLIVYPFFNIVYRRRTIIILVATFVVVGLMMGKYLLNVFGSVLIDSFSHRINQYMEAGSSDNTMAYSTIFVLIKGLANRCILLGFFLYYFTTELRRHNRMVNGLFNIYIIGTVLYCILLPVSISLARIAVYMDIVQVFLVSMILFAQRSIANRLLLFLLFFVYYFLRFYTYLYSYEDEFIPFKTIFS